MGKCRGKSLPSGHHLGKVPEQECPWCVEKQKEARMAGREGGRRAGAGGGVREAGEEIMGPAGHRKTWTFSLSQWGRLQANTEGPL